MTNNKKFMRYYEIVIIINSNYTNEIDKLLDNYFHKITSNLGKIYNLEKIGIRDLSYPIKKMKQAYYVIINIGCCINLMKELEENIKTNEIIIRHIIIRTKHPITKKSKLFINK